MQIVCELYFIQFIELKKRKKLWREGALESEKHKITELEYVALNLAKLQDE